MNRCEWGEGPAWLCNLGHTLQVNMCVCAFKSKHTAGTETHSICFKVTESYCRIQASVLRLTLSRTCSLCWCVAWGVTHLIYMWCNVRGGNEEMRNVYVVLGYIHCNTAVSQSTQHSGKKCLLDFISFEFGSDDRSISTEIKVDKGTNQDTVFPALILC